MFVVMSEFPKPKKVYTQHQAFLKAQHYCAYQERSQSEVRSKIYSWGMNAEETENIIVDLIGENFLHEERFAMAYAHGKFTINKWGKIKIRQGLKMKGVSAPLIQLALNQFDPNEYYNTLQSVLSNYAATVQESNPYKRYAKIMRYAISKGYESDLAKEILGEI